MGKGSGTRTGNKIGTGTEMGTGARTVTGNCSRSSFKYLERSRVKQLVQYNIKILKNAYVRSIFLYYFISTIWFTHKHH